MREMDFLHDAYPLPPQHQPPQMYYQAIPYPAYTAYPQPALDDMYGHYSHEYADFIPPEMMHGEYEEMGEVSTRPRLTKEQVEVLEAQFQTHPKPNGVLKRQLAIQTKLTLPRVANWFQNRRAKAKQQKKQEEFEISQARARRAGAKEESNSPGSTPTQHDGSAAAAAAAAEATGADAMTTAAATASTNAATVTEAIAQRRPSDSPSKQSMPELSTSVSTAKTADDSKEGGWASLQRTLGAAKVAAHQHVPPDSRQMVSMAPPDLCPQTMSMQLPLRLSSSVPTTSMTAMSDWTNKAHNVESWPSPVALHDTSFDFGFNPDVLAPTSSHESVPGMSPLDIPQQAFVLSPGQWQEPLTTPKANCPSHVDASNPLPSPSLPMPSYPTSRRSSMADDLSATLGTFALTGSSPHAAAPPLPPPGAIRRPDGQIDIAARRKRPRPAALTSASLRSRSYGALTSVSPTFRQAVTPPASHTVRHVKSSGASLNARYAGIRKASSAQRSPMHVSSFAEAEAFNRLMAQQAAVAATAAQSRRPSVQLSDMPIPVLTPDMVANLGLTSAEKGGLSTHDMSPYRRLPVTQQHLTMSATSPPTTPFQSESFRPDYMTRGPSQQSMVPVSAPPRYASFPDSTPPYSAGPLTNSSWSDAPLTSPELPTFPPATCISSLNFALPSEDLTAHFQQFVLPSDTTLDATIGSSVEAKKTEFHIQEFPNQKEAHAHVAQQLAQQRPKSYVFANTAPKDYDPV